MLSYADLVNPDYGFSAKASYSKETQGDKINVADDSTLDAMRKRRSYSDYSTIMGVRTSQQATTVDGEPVLAWMLRSPGAHLRLSICGVALVFLWYLVWMIVRAAGLTGKRLRRTIPTSFPEVDVRAVFTAGTIDAMLLCVLHERLLVYHIPCYTLAHGGCGLLWCRWSRQLNDNRSDSILLFFFPVNCPRCIIVLQFLLFSFFYCT